MENEKLKQLRNQCLSAFICGFILLLSASATAQKAAVPKIDWVEPLRPQPFERDPDVIWYDSFDDEESQKRYAERSGQTTDADKMGGVGRSLWMQYPKRHRGIGNRKVFFGDSPVYPRETVRRGERFTDVYWRIYVKHQRGWTGGGPAKMSRATSLTAVNWQQAIIAHVWGSRDTLTLDPASGVRGGRVVTRRYNDFGRLRWLGNAPGSEFRIHSKRESGRWVCVESRAKLNTPGKSDGCNVLWIDGLFQTERADLNWRGSYTKHGINGVFLEAYWNRGSPVDQSRWVDEFVISTRPIGPVYTGPNPTLAKTPYEGPGKQSAWEAGIVLRLDAEKPDAERIYSARTFRRRRRGRGEVEATIGEDVWGEVVWRSKPVKGETLALKVDATTGTFVGPLAGKQNLDPGRTYFCRVRQKGTDGAWSDWSEWHQALQTAP